MVEKKESNKTDVYKPILLGEGYMTHLMNRIDRALEQKVLPLLDKFNRTIDKILFGKEKDK